MKIHFLTFGLDLGVNVTRNIAQYPLQHMTCLGTKFEVAPFNGLGIDVFKFEVVTSNGFGDKAFARKYII